MRFMIRLRKLFRRDKVKNILFPFVSLLTGGYLVYYIWWRGAHSLNPEAILFSVILLCAEIFGVVNFLLFAWMTQKIEEPPYCPPHKPNLTVDVFVPTYNENSDIIEATLIGCNKIRYPHKTYLLDDGNRDEARALAERFGCEYITRTNNIHGKAGNINGALEKTSGEFIVVLDCDMVPQPDFLDRTLGYFEDENLAIIQLPQVFYNADSIQHIKGKKRIWHEQQLFYRVIQPGKNHSNSAFWCGSPSVLRRKAIIDIGGVATETITEDIHTSIRLHSKGWATLFLNEVLAFGIAPQTLKSFLLQRLRWAQGTMQLYRSRENPLIIPGLTLRQRISYLASLLAYFESFQKFIFIMTPTIILLIDVFPMRVSGLDFFMRWTPYFLLSMVANRLSGRGYFDYWQTEKYNLLKMITFMQSILILLWPIPLKFKVTPKSTDNTVYKGERQELKVYFVLLGFITAVVLIELMKVLFGLGHQSENPLFTMAAMFWATYNAFIILLGIREVLSRRHERKQYRFPVTNDARIVEYNTGNTIANVKMLDVSLLGAGFVCEGDIDLVNKEIALNFLTPEGSSLSIPFNIAYQRKIQDGEKSIIGSSFTKLDPDCRRMLMEYIYITLPNSQFELDRKTHIQVDFTVAAIPKWEQYASIPIPSHWNEREALRDLLFSKGDVVLVPQEVYLLVDE